MGMSMGMGNGDVDEDGDGDGEDSSCALQACADIYFWYVAPTVAMVADDDEDDDTRSESNKKKDVFNNLCSATCVHKSYSFSTSCKFDKTETN